MTAKTRKKAEEKGTADGRGSTQMKVKNRCVERRRRIQQAVGRAFLLRAFFPFFPFFLFSFAYTLFLLPRPVLGEDSVLVRNKGGGRTRLEGTVVDYTGKELVLQLATGREQRFPGTAVLDIKTQYGPQHEAAEEALGRGDYQQAVALYREAVERETRRWVRHEILARAVECYRELAQWQPAAETFLLLVRDDPDTPYFDTIPLAWSPLEPSASLEQAALGWLGQSESPVAALLGASYLMSTGSRPAALARLERLVVDADPRVASLALAQTWRAKIVTASPEELTKWSRAIERMPEPLRAGPYWVLGRGWMRPKMGDQAAFALLRVPILYPPQPRLASPALLEAARAMAESDQTSEAVRLYREVLSRYPDTRQAAEARRQLETLAPGKR